MTQGMSWSRLRAAITSIDAGLVDALAPGASDERIEGLAKSIGTVPPVLEGWLRTHDGQAMRQVEGGGRAHRPLLAMLDLLGTATIADEWSTTMEVLGDDEEEMDVEGPVRPRCWLPKWIPFVLIGGESRYFCLDFQPALGGAAGQVIEVSHEYETRRCVAPSLDAWFAQIAELIETGKAKYDPARGIDVFDQIGVRPHATSGR